MTHGNDSHRLAGFRVDSLIAAPLQGAARASLSLADATLEYISRVGPASADFSFEKPTRSTESGEIIKDRVDVRVPLLALAPAPNLQIDRMDVEFSLEVKSVEKQTDKSGELADEEVTLYGNLASPKDRTRQQDNFSKYNIRLQATNHGISEAMARVFDLMATAIAPRQITRQDAGGDEPISS